jgi:Phosphodiester glycosidase
MMFYKKKLLGFFMLLLIVVGCSKQTANNNPVTTPVVTTPIALIQLAPGWKTSTTLSARFPTGIALYFFDSIFAGKKTKAFCLVYDSKLSTIEFKPVLSATAKKPSEFYADEVGVVYGCINAGFFGGNQSFSMVKYNGNTLSPNIKSVSRVLNGVSTAYYPTRAALGVSSTGIPSAHWIYHVGTGNDLVYSYPNPSANAEGIAPQSIPSASFPLNGVVWNPLSAIGGSPMLLRNGNNSITDIEELININNTTSRPRSAIGYTANGMVVLMAVEGDNTSAGYAGVNLLELTSILKSLGCTDAINLDGGGSTSLVVSNQLMVRPGDNGIERGVISALLIKQK